MPTENNIPPQDIRDTATRMSAAWTSPFPREAIEQAILAERRRCIDLCLRVGAPEWSEETNCGYALAAREIAEDIESGRGVQK